MQTNVLIVLLFLLVCCVVISLLIILDMMSKKRHSQQTKLRKRPLKKKESKTYLSKIQKLTSECRLVSDRLNTLLAISSTDCTGKTIQQQLEEIADLVSLRFRNQNISISCSISVSLPSYTSSQEQVIRVASKNYSPKAKVAISEDLVLKNKLVGKIQIHTLSDSDLPFLEGEKPFLRSVSRIVSKVMNKMISGSKLQEKLKMFRDILDSSTIIALVLDPDFRVIFYNKALSNITGWTFRDFKKKSFFDIIDIETGQSVREIRDQQVTSFISTVRHKNGSLVRVIWDVSRLNGNLLLVGRDVTREFNLKSKTIKLHQERYLEQIAKAVANDLNNCLTAVIGQSQVLLSKKRVTKKEVQKLLDSARSCTKIADRLLSLTKIKTSDTEIQLNQEIEDLINKLKIPSTVSVNVKSEPDLVVKMDEGQLLCILESLMTNSIESGADKVDIELGKEVIPLEEVDGSIYSGLFVRLTFIDNGCGIKKKDVAKIFEPYFSTKRNLGLGLTLVRRIVNSYNGFIKVLSSPGKGTKISIYLPTSKSYHRKDVQNVRVLIVDDDKHVSEIIQNILVKKNIKSDISNSFKEAIELCTNNNYDIVILDLMLPNGEGTKLIEEIKRLQPDARIVVCSGYPNGEIISDTYRVSCYLQKPFDIPELLTVIERVLNGYE